MGWLGLRTFLGGLHPGSVYPEGGGEGGGVSQSWVPNHQQWCAKWKLGWNILQYTLHAHFCTFGANLHAHSVLINNISASKLSRKFIKRALLVGQPVLGYSQHYLVHFPPLPGIQNKNKIFRYRYFPFSRSTFRYPSVISSNREFEQPYFNSHLAPSPTPSPTPKKPEHQSLKKNPFASLTQSCVQHFLR